jgi:hypothetical protein
VRVPAPRLAIAAAVAFAAAAALCGALPLLEVPGYELGALAALAFALVLGPALGIAAARIDASPWRAFARAAAVAAALLAVLLAAGILRALPGPCDPLFGAPMFLAAALPSAWLACALGVAAASLPGARRRPAAAYAAVALALLATSVARAWRGPAAALHDHLFGFWPGPIYDEVLVLDRPLLAWRAGTLALALAAVAAAAALRAGRGRAARASALAAAAALVAGAALAGVPTASRAGLERALGGRVDGERCVLHYPRERPREDAERLWRECEDSAARVATALALESPPRVRVWAYRGPAEKRRLVGAAETSYTKPWLAEIHLHWGRSPHPLLAHEVVHAVASAAAPAPLRVPARLWVLPNGGLLEGLATALAPRPPYTIHQRARALRDLRLAPRMARLMGDAGFFSAAPARAYVAAGSFVAFLLERRGGAPVRAVYGHRDFRRAFGEPLESLEAEWNRFLDGVEVPEALRAEAEARFRDPGLFGTRCAREVAARAGG